MISRERFFPHFPVGAKCSMQSFSNQRGVFNFKWESLKFWITSKNNDFLTLFFHNPYFREKYLSCDKIHWWVTKMYFWLNYLSLPRNISRYQNFLTFISYHIIRNEIYSSWERFPRNPYKLLFCQLDGLRPANSVRIGCWLKVSSISGLLFLHKLVF